MEADGIGTSAAGYGTKYYCPNGVTRTVTVNKPIDWNCNGVIDTSPVKVNINGDIQTWEVVGLFKFVDREGIFGYAPFEYVAQVNHLPGRAYSYRLVTERHDRAYQDYMGEKVDTFLRDQGIKVRQAEAAHRVEALAHGGAVERAEERVDGVTLGPGLAPAGRALRRRVARAGALPRLADHEHLSAGLGRRAVGGVPDLELHGLDVDVAALGLDHELVRVLVLEREPARARVGAADSRQYHRPEYLH